jgi:hypothetical protein
MVTEAWALLPDPSGIPLQGVPRVEDLNFFEYTENFFISRVKSIQKVRELIASASRSEPGPKVSKRYNEGLMLMTASQLGPLNEFLDHYLRGLEAEYGQ